MNFSMNLIIAKNFGGVGMRLLCYRKNLDEQDLMQFIW
jgi:hypothetical protein